MNARNIFGGLGVLIWIAACGPATTGVEMGDTDQTDGDEAVAVADGREAPPESGSPRDVSFPAITRSQTESGLEVNAVEWNQLPVVYLRLVIKSGGEADPADKPGLAHLVGAMLKEGTRTRSSAQLAEQVEFLGADLSVGDDEENIYIAMRALSEHLDQALDLLADVAMNPLFRQDELSKLKRRELDRLALQDNDPGFLAAREFNRALYGEHPYAHIDTTADVLRRVSRTDLSRWHREHFVPNNAFLVVAGNATNEAVQQSTNRAFSRWHAGTVPAVTYPTLPNRDQRQVIVVDRPESVQSVISIGNLALSRSDENYVPLMVANQVLGGSAASRLFMDLRERRSLTYGAYSRIGEAVDMAPFRASASVRTEVTAEAMQAFFEHLDRITREATPADELHDAHRYLSDRFPLQIDTPAKIASMVADLRIYGLADDYWDGFRSSIREVTSEQALAAARQYVRPDQSLVVVVGKAADIVPSLRRYGPVLVLDKNGDEVQRFDATASPSSPAAAAPSATPAAEEASATE